MAAGNALPDRGTFQLATGNGGTVTAAAKDTPYGRLAELADPFGAVFSVVTSTGPAPRR